MDKFLFTDGMSGVKEVQSQEELENLIRSTADTSKINIWIFNSAEWISYSAYRKKFAAPTRKTEPVATTAIVTTQNIKPIATRKGKRWLKRVLFFTLLLAGAFLVFNFTKVRWRKAAPLESSATRPENVPFMDVDSLISEIEYDRGETLGENTKNNLRLRNTWPDLITVKLHANKEISNSGTRFSNATITVDNTTGLNVDKTIVRLFVWKNNKVSSVDTVRFLSVPYDRVSLRTLDTEYRGDSLSVAFESIRAKAFNFCYASSVKNNSGNYNDRWFCKE